MQQLSKPISIDDDLFELNPFLRGLHPYSRLTPREMMRVFLMNEPDDRINPFANMAMAEREERYDACVIEHPEAYREAVEKYPFDFMTVPERALQAEREKLQQRAKFLRETPITLDHTEIVASGTSQKALQIKGTASQLEAMHKNTEAIYKQYNKVEEMYSSERAKAKIHGGGELTLTEKGEI